MSVLVLDLLDKSDPRTPEEKLAELEAKIYKGVDISREAVVQMIDRLDDMDTPVTEQAAQMLEALRDRVDEDNETIKATDMRLEGIERRLKEFADKLSVDVLVALLERGQEREGMPVVIEPREAAE